MKMSRNTLAMYKNISIFERSGFLALANVQMHLERHIKFFQESKIGFQNSNQNTGAEKAIRQMVNGNIQGRRSSDKTTEVEMDPYEKTS